MQLPDNELTNQRICFMHAAPHLWGWDALTSLHTTRAQHIEHRGPETNPVTFMLDVLETGQDERGEFIHVATHAFDARLGKVLGISYIPLCGSVIIYRSGRIEYGTIGNLAADQSANNSFKPTVHRGVGQVPTIR